MPISSLPSPYGIGTVGKAAYDFITFLAKAGQSYWQILPVGPISYGDSPYQSFSTFAGNPYFIDLDILIEEGLLLQSEVDAVDWGTDEEHVDYGKIYENRFDILKMAVSRALKGDRVEFDRFCEEKGLWLFDYALFMALKRHFGMKSWIEWPDEAIRKHEAEAVDRYAQELEEDVTFFAYLQFLFFKQWNAMREFANEQGIQIIGDLPIYVAMDSADVWSNPWWFQLDEENMPTEVSGCPPDSFSATGQLWGNPLYRWDRMAEDGYGWWLRRVDGALQLYDALRIDHFRGFESYWAIPYGDTTALNGHWVKGPDMGFVGVLRDWFRQATFIAEDLGFLTDDVRRVLWESGFPGMKVLEFAFDSREPSNYLPHTYSYNSVCYTGTHDNSPVGLWQEEAEEADLKFAKKYLRTDGREGMNWGMIRGGMGSVANLFIAQMQDYLGLGKGSRMNIPGVPEGNWTWRMKPGAISERLIEKIKDTTVLYGRYYG